MVSRGDGKEERERKIEIKYYDATGWTKLPDGGLAGLAHYDTDTSYSIDYPTTDGNFAGSGRNINVAALFSGYVYIDPVTEWLCITSRDASRLYLDNVLKIDKRKNLEIKRRCTEVTGEGVYKFDVEYFSNSVPGGSLTMTFGPNRGRLRIVPPRSFASVRKVTLMLLLLFLFWHHRTYLIPYCFLLQPLWYFHTIGGWTKKISRAHETE